MWAPPVTHQNLHLDGVAISRTGPGDDSDVEKHQFGSPSAYFADFLLATTAAIASRGSYSLGRNTLTQEKRFVPEVEIPSRYRVPTQGEALIEVNASTVRTCIEAVEVRCPGFQELIFDRKGDLNRFVKLFLNGDQLDRDALDIPVSGSDRVSVVAAAAGG